MKQFAKITLIAIFLFIGQTAKSQMSERLVLGLKAGVAVSTLSGYPYENMAKPTFNFGVTMDYKLNESLYITSAVEFVNKGAKFHLVNEHPEGNRTVTFDKSTVCAMYLQMPLHVGYRFNVSQNTNVVVHAGPYIAYGLSGKVELGDKVILKTSEGTTVVGLNDYIVSIGGVSREEETFSEEAFKKFDWGLGAGAKLEYNNTNIGVRYDIGLYDLARWDKGVYNKNFYATVGYKF